MTSISDAGESEPVKSVVATVAVAGSGLTATLATQIILLIGDGRCAKAVHLSLSSVTS